MKQNEITIFQKIFNQWLPGLLESWGVPDLHITWVSAIAGLVVVAAVLFVVTYGLAKLFTYLLKRVAKKTDSRFDDHLVEHRLPHYFGRIIPLITAYNLVPVVLAAFPKLIRPMEHLIIIFFLVLAVRIIRAFLRAGKDTMEAKETYRGKPLDSYLQVITLILYIIGGLAVLSQLTGSSIGNFFVSMGAASAVLMLIFKDTILGFVASIQVSANDMVRVGDWIAMPKNNADGDVIGINLTTVKVRNFDRTVTTIPTYALISDSFINYRPMQEAGGRRIKRSMRIKMSSIRYITPEELEQFARIGLLRDYVHKQQEEVDAYNKEHEIDKSLLLNGRNQTNIGLFRKYVETYLAEQTNLRKDMGTTVRQLQPDEFGLPLEIYCWSRDVSFKGIEAIQANIFDHLIASASTFGLEIYEKPASDDIRYLAKEVYAAGQSKS